MTIPPARIERLWKACPELRPQYMEIHAKYGFVTDEEEGICIAHAHALIRDRIVWWLAEQSFYLMPVAHSPGSNGRWHFQLVGSDSSKEASWCESGEDFGADPALACILAAERVLGLPEWVEQDIGDFRT